MNYYSLRLKPVRYADILLFNVMLCNGTVPRVREHICGYQTLEHIVWNFCFVACRWWTYTWCVMLSELCTISHRCLISIFFYRCLSTFHVCTASVWLFVQPAAILGQNRPRAIHTGYVFCETLTSMNINPRCPVDCPGTQYRGRFSLLCGNSCAKGSSDGPQTIQDWYTKEANCFTSSAWTNVRCDISAPLVFRCKSKSCYAQCNASHNSADKA